MAARDETLSLALDDLNSALYSESDSDWQGKNLWLAISQLSFAQQHRKTTAMMISYHRFIRLKSAIATLSGIYYDL